MGTSVAAGQTSTLFSLSLSPPPPQPSKHVHLQLRCIGYSVWHCPEWWSPSGSVHPRLRAGLEGEVVVLCGQVAPSDCAVLVQSAGLQSVLGVLCNIICSFLTCWFLIVGYHPSSRRNMLLVRLGPNHLLLCGWTSLLLIIMQRRREVKHKSVRVNVFILTAGQNQL